MEHNTNKFACGTAFISTDTGRVLLNLRAAYKTHSLTWSLWGGMSEENETPKECLLRELSEEMGFVPDISKIYPFDVYESTDKNFRYYSFICVVAEEFIPKLNEEAAGYCWIQLGEWPKPMHQGAKKTLCANASLEKLKIILSQHKES